MLEKARGEVIVDACSEADVGIPGLRLIDTKPYLLK
jgi:hypothetical protein